MKKIYTNPKMDILNATASDIITLSIGLNIGGIFNENDPVSMEDEFTDI